MKFKGFAATHQGSRQSNQDAFVVDDERGIYAVADGVGGGMQGDVAAQMAIAALASVSTAKDLSEVVKEAHSRILEKAITSFGDAIMGTTLSALVLHDDTLTFAHAGDSRIYLFSENCLRLLTRDQDAFDDGVGAPVLQNYLGVQQEFDPFYVQDGVVKVKNTDKILLCTDGLHHQLNEYQIQSFLKNDADDPQVLVRVLCQEASMALHSDNITVVYVVLD